MKTFLIIFVILPVLLMATALLLIKSGTMHSHAVYYQAMEGPHMMEWQSGTSGGELIPILMCLAGALAFIGFFGSMAMLVDKFSK
jgi:hypothetical protein